VYAAPMKISLDWLSDFLVWKEENPRVIADRLTVSVGEVEHLVAQGAALAHCCVGKVLSVDKHPNADKLSLCTVETDKGKKRVVCGGTNLHQGMRVAFAHIGARVLWHGEESVTLDRAKIRGEESEGMICAAEELQLAAQFPLCTGHSIIDLGDGDEGVGLSLAQYLGLTDAVFHIDNHAITHRADLFSHIGVARECVALGLATWREDRPRYEAPPFSSKSLPFAHKVECKDLVPRYLACTLTIDALGETPLWMRRRLEAVGMRSVNLPVDITNYVTVEIGMPLHSFDLDDLQGDIRMRLSKKGEAITTLDEVERVLPEGALVLSDRKGIFDLMGIMGGLRSSTKETTKRIYLHSAVIDPATIRRTIIATGHRTDAATVYEKGIPPVAAATGFYRALQLFLEHVPGAIVTSSLDSWGDDGVPPSIPLKLPRIAKVLGTDIPESAVRSIFLSLGFDVQKKGEDALTVTPPLWRMGDITGAHDLIEEVARIYGYDALDTRMPSASITPPVRDHRIARLRDALKEEGFFEVLPLTLIGPQLLKRAHMEHVSAPEIENALGEEFSLLQPSVLPGLLEHAQENLRYSAGHLKTFSWGQVFEAGTEGHREWGMLVACKEAPGVMDDPLLLLKRSLFYATRMAGHQLSSRTLRKVPSFAHPGRAAEVLAEDTVVGRLFEVHPAVRSAFDLPQRCAVLLLNLDELLALPPTASTPRTVPQYPAVEYDVTITCTPERSVAHILTQARSGCDLLERLEIVDLFQPRDAQGIMHITLRCTYRAPDRTLTEEEAKREHEKVVAALGGA